jgi:hypothetical protein
MREPATLSNRADNRSGKRSRTSQYLLTFCVRTEEERKSDSLFHCQLQKIVNVLVAWRASGLLVPAAKGAPSNVHTLSFTG